MPALFLNAIFLALLFTTVVQTAFAQEVYETSSNYVLGVEAFQEGDYRRAFDAWSLGAYEGNAEAQYNLGVLYLEGHGIKADVDQARAWFSKAAHQNHSEAQYNLGHMSLNGMGVEKNVETALRWWKRAAEGGYAQAQFNYGRALYLGIEGYADKQGGLRLIRQAAQQKDKRALNYLENNAAEIAQLERHNIEKTKPVVVTSKNSDLSAQVVALDDVETVQKAVAASPEARAEVDNNVWLFTQEKDAYAIQLFSLLNIEKAHTIALESSFHGRAHLYTTQINNKKWAVLLLGPYTNAAAAGIAHQALPADYAGLGDVRLISSIASQRCAIRDRLDAAQSVGLDAYCL